MFVTCGRLVAFALVETLGRVFARNSMVYVCSAFDEENVELWCWSRPSEKLWAVLSAECGRRPESAPGYRFATWRRGRLVRLILKKGAGVVSPLTQRFGGAKRLQRSARGAA